MNNEFTVDGVVYQVKRPGPSENTRARMEYNKAFSRALDSGAPLREKLQIKIKEQGIWTDEKEKEFLRLVDFLSDSEKQLKAGGSLSKAAETAKEMRKARVKLNQFLVDRANSDSNTVEGQAENAHFQRLLTLCLVYKDNDTKYVYNTVEELLENSESEIAQKGFDILSNMIHKVDNRYEYKLPENKFLYEWGFVDEKLRYVDKDGNLVDEFGRRVNDKGQLVNEEGHRVDGEGNLIDEDGNIEVPDDEVKPFTDDSGNPLTPKRKLED